MQLSALWRQHRKRPVVFRDTRHGISHSIRRGVRIALSSGIFIAISGCSSLPNAYEANLADHLSESGAKMYGAYWCPHCAIQKDYFGGAVSRIPYIECDLEGINNEAALCQEMGITAYPTWIIEGEYYLGAQPLGKLARLSGFEGAIATERDMDAVGEFSPAN